MNLYGFLSLLTLPLVLSCQGQQEREEKRIVVEGNNVFVEWTEVEGIKEYVWDSEEGVRFREFVRENPDEAMLMEEESLEEEYGVEVSTSEDGNLRLYSWDTGTGGTMIQWGNVCQYRSGGKLYMSDRCFMDIVDDPDGESEWSGPGCSVGEIVTLHKNNGSTVYLVEGYIRESGNRGIQCVYAIGIEEGRLVPVKLFSNESIFYNDDTDDKEEELDIDEYAVGLDYSIADWYFRANCGEGWEWVCNFDKERNILYIAKDVGYLTDQYRLYKFDGERMIELGVGGGYWLHPSIRGFDSLEILFDTESYRVRVDRMVDETYRYVSWDRGVPMSEEPSLVLYDGYYDEDAKRFIFKNNEYLYEVEVKDYLEETLFVKKKGRLILTQNCINVY